MKRVVITGIGPVTAAGIGLEAFAQNVWRGRCLAQPIPESFTRRAPLKSGWYVPLPEADLAAHGVELPPLFKPQTGDKLALLAAKLALENAGLPARSGPEESRPFEVILGTGLGWMQTALDSHLAHLGAKPEARDAASSSPLVFNRMVVPATMTNAPAAWVSIGLGLTGASHSLSASCASGTCAIGEAFRHVRDGEAEVALAGGVEALVERTGFMMRGFDALGALTTAADGQPCPFGRGRSGFLFAEGGACVLVLEELAGAQRRGARILAEVLEYRANSDASHIVQIERTGRQVRALLAGFAGHARIDYLNAHGTATQANDTVEAEAVLEVFGPADRQPLINSTKGIMGHTLGASGAIETAVTALSLHQGDVHPNATRDPLPELRLPLEPTEARLEHALTVSYGFGGHNAGLLLKRYG